MSACNNKDTDYNRLVNEFYNKYYQIVINSDAEKISTCVKNISLDESKTKILELENILEELKEYITNDKEMEYDDLVK